MDAFAADSSMTVWNAATMGLVMSLANPHSAKSDVMRMNVTRYFRGTTGCLPAVDETDFMVWI